MKKLLVLFPALLLTAGLVSCGGTEGNSGHTVTAEEAKAFIEKDADYVTNASTGSLIMKMEADLGDGAGYQPCVEAEAAFDSNEGSLYSYVYQNITELGAEYMGSTTAGSSELLVYKSGSTYSCLAALNGTKAMEQEGLDEDTALSATTQCVTTIKSMASSIDASNIIDSIEDDESFSTKSYTVSGDYLTISASLTSDEATGTMSYTFHKKGYISAMSEIQSNGTITLKTSESVALNGIVTKYSSLKHLK